MILAPTNLGNFPAPRLNAERVSGTALASVNHLPALTAHDYAL